MKKSQHNFTFHDFYTVFYLPISIVVSLICTINSINALRNVVANSLFSYLEITSLIFPLIVFVLNTFSFFVLLGSEKKGIKDLLFSSTFKTLLSIFVLFYFMLQYDMKRALIVFITGLFNSFIYGYYVRRMQRRKIS